MRQVSAKQPPQLPPFIQLLVNDLAQDSYLECCIAAAQALAVVGALRLLPNCSWLQVSIRRHCTGPRFQSSVAATRAAHSASASLTCLGVADSFRTQMNRQDCRCGFTCWSEGETQQGNCRTMLWVQHCGCSISVNICIHAALA